MLVGYDIVFVVRIDGLMLQWNIDGLCWQLDTREVL
jgi:hypothetical protein